jgi:hypothetical protein
MAAPAVIGVADSRGEIRLNRVSVPGGATLIEGARLETVHTASDVSLRSGGHLLLASASTATLHRDHAVLENGTIELNGATGYGITTRDLRIAAAAPDARVRVGVDAAHRIQIESTRGTAEVRTSQGILVARVVPGAALQLSQAADRTTRLTGKVRSVNGRYLLTDETTKVTVELRGDKVAKMVGKRVDVTGSVIAGEAAAGASQIVAVSTVAVKAGAAAGAASAGAAAGHMSTTTIAVIGGVAAAGATVGGLAAAGTIGGDDSPSVSR